ncbi:MAG: hypothetical protein RLZZ399_1567 [Verrucomicrobiota bacterium]|jgi:hypothetical protein
MRGCAAEVMDKARDAESRGSIRNRFPQIPRVLDYPRSNRRSLQERPSHPPPSGVTFVGSSHLPKSTDHAQGNPIL